MPNLFETKDKLQTTKEQLQNTIENLDDALKTESSSFFSTIKELLDIPLNNFSDDSKIPEITYLNNKLSAINDFLNATKNLNQTKLGLIEQLQEVESEETRKKLFDAAIKDFTDGAKESLSIENDFFDLLTEKEFDTWLTKDKTQIIDSKTQEVQQAVFFIKELHEINTKLDTLKSKINDPQLADIETELNNDWENGELTFDKLRNITKKLQNIEIEPLIEQRDKLKELMAKLLNNSENKPTKISTIIDLLLNELEEKIYLKQIPTTDDIQLTNKLIDNLENIPNLYKTLLELQKNLENLPKEAGLYEIAYKRLNETKKSLDDFDITDQHLETNLDQINHELKKLVNLEKHKDKIIELANALNKLQLAIQNPPPLAVKLKDSAEILSEKLETILKDLASGITTTIDQHNIDVAAESVNKLFKFIDLNIGEHLDNLKKDLENSQHKEGKTWKLAKKRLIAIEQTFDKISINPKESILEFENTLDRISEELASIETLKKLEPTITEATNQLDELQILIDNLPESTTKLKKAAEVLFKNQQEKLQTVENGVIGIITKDDINSLIATIKTLKIVKTNKNTINKLKQLKNDLEKLPLEEGLRKLTQDRLGKIETQINELSFDDPNIENTLENITKELQHIENLA